MTRRPLLYILVSAACFGISPPIAKILVADIPPLVLAGLLYSGAFLGLSLFALARKVQPTAPEAPGTGLRGKDLPWRAGYAPPPQPRPLKTPTQSTRP